MIAINKNEASLLREYFPHVHVTRTMKQKSGRHHYYCEENKRAMAFLQNVKSGHSPAVAMTMISKKNVQRKNVLSKIDREG